MRSAEPSQEVKIILAKVGIENLIEAYLTKRPGPAENRKLSVGAKSLSETCAEIGGSRVPVT